ncbi:MAG: TerB family tellurite resistance protein [Cytophagales bacterium]|nr:TerB family tellurite resistance protein [Cytophagales bacterium]
MPKAHLNILIQLARVDGEVSENEKALIYQVGAANGLSQPEIDAMLDQPAAAAGDLSHLAADEKFEYVFSIVQLMKIDGKLFRDEINYCSDLAARLGYDRAVIFELIMSIQQNPKFAQDKEDLKQKVQAYLS